MTAHPSRPAPRRTPFLTLILAVMLMGAGCSGDVPAAGSLSMPEELARRANERAPLVAPKKGAVRPAGPRAGRR
jgi:hypothetical protein